MTEAEIRKKWSGIKDCPKCGRSHHVAISCPRIGDVLTAHDYHLRMQACIAWEIEHDAVFTAP